MSWPGQLIGNEDKSTGHYNLWLVGSAGRVSGGSEEGLTLVEWGIKQVFLEEVKSS